MSISEALAGTSEKLEISGYTAEEITFVVRT